MYGDTAFLEKEQLKKKKRVNEISTEEKELAHMKLKEIEDNKRGIEKLKDDFKVAKKDENALLKVSNKLLDKENKHLKKALDANDFVFNPIHSFDLSLFENVFIKVTLIKYIVIPIILCDIFVCISKLFKSYICEMTLI